MSTFFSEMPERLSDALEMIEENILYLSFAKVSLELPKQATSMMSALEDGMYPV